MSVGVDRGSPIPAWYQLARDLRQRIESGTLRPGQSIGTESDLISQYEIGRSTVRRALEELHRSGWLDRPQPRRPLLVSQRPVVQDAGGVAGLFSAGFTNRGSTIEIVVRRAEQCLNAPIATQLGDDPRSKLFRIERLFRADGIPAALETAWLPAERFPGLLRYDLTKPLTTVLKEVYDVDYAAGEQRLSARLADIATAKVLKLTRPAPLIEITRLSVTKGDTPIEYMEGLLRADRYVLAMKFPTGRYQVMRGAAAAQRHRIEKRNGTG